MDALRLHAEHLDAEDEIAAMVERADANLAAGRYAAVATVGDGQVLHKDAMARLRARLAEDGPGPRAAGFLARPRTTSTA